jgi:hypothetical protein
MPLSTGESRDYTIAMVNDEDTPRNGRLRLLFTDAAGQGSRGPGIAVLIGAAGCAVVHGPADCPGSLRQLFLAGCRSGRGRQCASYAFPPGCFRA